MNLNKKTIIILSITIFFILSAIIAVIIASSRPSEPTITITNWDKELSETPEDTRIHIAKSLYSQVVSFSDITSTQKATIRDSSTNSTKIENNFTIGDFIIDIPDIEQSYAVQYFYGSLENQPTTEISASAKIICITNPEQIIYPNFSCT